MLIFSRKNNQSIRITVGGETIWIHVSDAYMGRAKVGIDAPVTAQIWRGELVTKADEEASCEWIREASRARAPQ